MGQEFGLGDADMRAGKQAGKRDTQAGNLG